MYHFVIFFSFLVPAFSSDVIEHAAALSDKLFIVYYFFLTGRLPAEDFVTYEHPLTYLPHRHTLSRRFVPLYDRFCRQFSNLETMRRLLEEHLNSEAPLNRRLLRHVNTFVQTANAIPISLIFENHNRLHLRNWVKAVLLLIPPLRRSLNGLGIYFPLAV